MVFTNYSNQSQKEIYFVPYENQADLKIYYVDYENQAGWNNSSKKFVGLKSFQNATLKNFVFYENLHKNLSL